MTDKKKDTRTRNWTIVVYPESAPDNWRDIVEEWHIEWVESPLHDKDINADGEPKKPHWHLLLLFGSVKSLEQVTELVQPLNCPTPFGVHNSKALVRYMAHLDNPDKVQYNVSDIQCHGGIDLMDLLKPSSSERYTYIREMQSWCNEHNIVEFCDLFDYAAKERLDDWYPLLCDSCAFVMNQFLKSKRHSKSTKACIDDSVEEDLPESSGSEASGCDVTGAKNICSGNVPMKILTLFDAETADYMVEYIYSNISLLKEYKYYSDTENLSIAEWIAKYRIKSFARYCEVQHSITLSDSQDET